MCFHVKCLAQFPVSDARPAAQTLTSSPLFLCLRSFLRSLQTLLLHMIFDFADVCFALHRRLAEPRARASLLSVCFMISSVNCHIRLQDVSHRSSCVLHPLSAWTTPRSTPRSWVTSTPCSLLPLFLSLCLSLSISFSLFLSLFTSLSPFVTLSFSLSLCLLFFLSLSLSLCLVNDIGDKTQTSSTLNFTHNLPRVSDVIISHNIFAKWESRVSSTMEDPFVHLQSRENDDDELWTRVVHRFSTHYSFSHVLVCWKFVVSSLWSCARARPLLALISLRKLCVDDSVKWSNLTI